MRSWGGGGGNRKTKHRWCVLAIIHYLHRVKTFFWRTRHILVVVLPNPFRGMETWRNSTEIQQSGHAPWSGPEVKNVSSAKDNAPERLRCRTIQEEVSQILQRVSAGAARILLPFYPA